MYPRMASKVYDLDIAIFRPVNTYGRLHETGFLIEYLITKMLENQKVYIGAPNSIRDFIFKTDHVAAYELALEKNPTMLFKSELIIEAKSQEKNHPSFRTRVLFVYHVAEEWNLI